MSFDSKQHWEKVYQEKGPSQVSWYQEQPSASLDLVFLSKIGKTGRIIDVGGGASILVDKLMEKGFNDITVLDISANAIKHAKERLDKQAAKVTWIESDITQFESSQQFDLWHDRAVFHFLTSSEDRKKYIEIMEKTIKPGGHVIIASFALDGPMKCSGLDVERYSPEKLKQELGDSFLFVKSIDEIHHTPWQSEQKFMYCYFQKKNR